MRVTGVVVASNAGAVRVGWLVPEPVLIPFGVVRTRRAMMGYYLRDGMYGGREWNRSEKEGERERTESEIKCIGREEKKEHKYVAHCSTGPVASFAESASIKQSFGRDSSVKSHRWRCRSIAELLTTVRNNIIVTCFPIWNFKLEIRIRIYNVILVADLHVGIYVLFILIFFFALLHVTIS